VLPAAELPADGALLPAADVPALAVELPPDPDEPELPALLAPAPPCSAALEPAVEPFESSEKLHASSAQSRMLAMATCVVRMVLPLSIMAA
jgi:hypothetical protein